MWNVVLRERKNMAADGLRDTWVLSSTKWGKVLISVSENPRWRPQISCSVHNPNIFCLPSQKCSHLRSWNKRLFTILCWNYSKRIINYPKWCRLVHAQWRQRLCFTYTAEIHNSAAEKHFVLLPINQVVFYAIIYYILFIFPTWHY